MKHFDSFALDTSNECLRQDGAPIALPPKPFAVLRYLVENPGRLITHDELLDALWPETFVQPQVLRTYMLDLRKALGDDARQPRYIQTQPKRGYRFVAQVTERPQPEPAAAVNPADTTARQPTNALEIRKPAIPDPELPQPEISEIIDRKNELALLRSHLDRAASGHRQVVFITGETGIGKSALADAFSRQAEAMQPVMVVRGQCVRGVAGREEYYPVMEALSQLCASPDGELACAILARMGPTWLAALGREPAAEANSVNHARKNRAPGDLCASLEELAAQRTLILVFEDLHWSDASTLDLISALARRRAHARLLVLATCGPADAAQAQPIRELRHDLRMRRLCAEIALPPLSRAAVKELLAARLGTSDLPPGLSAFVHQRSEGNPLFALAILEHLVAEGFLVRQQSAGAVHWRQPAPSDEMEAGIPAELARMIELDIERLSPYQQRLLEAGSLINIAFPAWAVAAALGEPDVHAEEACDELARLVHFLHRAGQDELPDGTPSPFYVFSHELYRQVLNRRQSAARRAAMHARIAQRLGELFAGRVADVAREMAMHYEAAGEWQRAADSLNDAATHARQRHAFDEAEELKQRARRMLDNLRESAPSNAVRLLSAAQASSPAVVAGMRLRLEACEKA
jgi:predicted ATPase/DNA-binding winged helix-turn-helix (wHTH) protein